MKTQVFWDTTVCRLVNNYRRFGGMLCLNLQRICNSLTLQIEATIPIHQSKGRRNLEAFNLNQHLYENLRFRRHGNVVKAKRINKDVTEDIGGGETYNVHHPVQAHGLQNCTEIRSHIRFRCLPLECFTLTLTSLDCLRRSAAHHTGPAVARERSGRSRCQG